jgi:hypothetical protein
MKASSTPGARLRAAAPLAALALACAALPAAAQGQGGKPVALVEEVAGRVAGIGEMDYMAAGQTIQLSQRDRIVLSYLNSCNRETITGGTITVGAEKSDVRNGEVRRETIACDAGRLRLSPQQAATSGVMVFRRAPGQSQAEITLHGRSPVVDGIGAGPIVIQRTDRPSDPLAVNVTGAMLRKRAVDLAQVGVGLEPGGVYTLKAGERSIAFRVAPDARAGRGPILGRLLRL